MSGRRTAVLLLFGGESSEHDISLLSARNVNDAIDRSMYDVTLGCITRQGEWLAVRSFDDTTGSPLVPLLGRGAFMVEGKTLAIDVILPILHGVHGEDGEVQGLAGLLHIPCTGPGLIGAAVTMDKDLTKRLVREAGVPVVEWLLWRTDDPMPGYDDTAARLGPLLFVKPSRSGSSVGVSKAHDAVGFAAALSEAARHDSQVLIETAITGKEVELAVIGNGKATVSTPGEIVSSADFYDFDDKYSSGSAAQVVIPSGIDERTVAVLTRYARDAYAAVRGRGMARIDFFVTEDGDAYLNEINSIPGFTNISMYPKLLQYDGTAYPAIIDKLIALALGAD